jgi:uridine phosphorylase
MATLQESELILNQDGSIYHLNLRPEQLSDVIITVGDPERVERVSRHFDSIEVQVHRREFVTHTGTYKGKRISVVSTGIGTDNIDIVLNELDALVNIDLEKREIKADRKSLVIIRVGTSGALQARIETGSHLASAAAVGMDSLMHFYQSQTNSGDTLTHALRERLGLGFTPYYATASNWLLEQVAGEMTQGITLTCGGFYGPQGRVLRLPVRNPDFIAELSRFRTGTEQLTNFEMETAGYYALGSLLGHHVLSLNAIAANRITGEFCADTDSAVNALILHALDRAANLPEEIPLR